MKKIYLLVTFTILNITLFAQSPTLDWAMKLGSECRANSLSSHNQYSGYNICVGKDGYIYSVGNFVKSIDYNGNDHYEACDIGGEAESNYILKQDKQGNVIWKKYICYGNGLNIKLDNLGNVNIFLFVHSGGITLDSTITGSNAISLNFGWHILRLDNQGNFIWVKSIRHKSVYENLSSYLFDSKNNLYLFGGIDHSLDFDPGIDTFLVTPTGFNGFILKLNNDGEFVWVKTIGDSLGQCKLGLSSIDKNDNIYFSGFFSDSIDIDLSTNKQYLYVNDTVNNNFNFSGTFIIKIDTNANLIWYKKDNKGGSVILTNDDQNNLILNGSFSDSTNFSNPNYSNLYFAKYKENGDFIWAKQFGKFGINDLKTDNAGNIYSNGFFEKTTFFNSDDTTIKTTSNGKYDIFLLKLDSSGNYVFDFTTGGKKDDICLGLDIDEDFNIYMTGTFNDTIDFDPSSVVENLNCHDTVRSIFITKFNQYPLAVNSVSKNSIAKLYPNPNNGIFTIEIKENATVMITNSFGQMVSKSQIKKGISMFNLQNQSIGIYFVQLQTDKDFETIKIVKD